MRHLWFRFVNAPRGDRGDQQPSSGVVTGGSSSSFFLLIFPHLPALNFQSPCSFLPKKYPCLKAIPLLPAHFHCLPSPCSRFATPCLFFTFSLVQLFWSSPFSLVPVMTPIIISILYGGNLFCYSVAQARSSVMKWKTIFSLRCFPPRCGIHCQQKVS